MPEHTTLLNSHGEILTIADRDMVMRYIKHELPEGDYVVRGPGIDLKVYKVGGMVYPGGGVVDGGLMPHRTREECVRTFGKGDTRFSPN